MSKEEAEKVVCSCPLCKAMDAAKHSEAVKHVRGLEREALLAARDLINWCVERIDKAEAGGEAKKTGTK